MPLKNVSEQSYKVTIITFGSSLVDGFDLKVNIFPLQPYIYY